jgi:phage terminase small subunit
VEKESAKKNEKPLSLRERLFIKALIAGDCPTGAMRKAGYAESTALRKAGEKLQKVQPAISDIAKSKEGMADAAGITTDFIEVPDFMARHKFLDTALKLKNKYPSKKHDANVHTETYEERLARHRGEGKIR